MKSAAQPYLWALLLAPPIRALTSSQRKPDEMVVFAPQIMRMPSLASSELLISSGWCVVDTVLLSVSE